MLRPSLVAPLALALALVPGTLAVKGPVMPVLTATKANKFSAKNLAGKIFAEKDLPPIELDVQLDFDVSFTSPPLKEKVAKVAKVVPKKVIKKVAPKVVSKKLSKAVARAIPPPPPPPPKAVAVKKVAPPPPPPPPPVAKKARKKTTKNKSLLSQLNAAKDRIGEHKYSKVIWATLLFVWTPLVAIWLSNLVMGKEFLIGMLISVLPESVPASVIEMVVEDGLWLGIFGVCIVATVGTVLVEATTAIAGSSTKKKKNL